MRLADKVAIVTGAGSGLGRAGALALARAGARVVASDLQADSAAATADAIHAAGGEARAIAADVSIAAECERLVQESVAAFGALHILYNNAGIALPVR